MLPNPEHEVNLPIAARAAARQEVHFSWDHPCDYAIFEPRFGCDVFGSLVVGKEKTSCTSCCMKGAHPVPRDFFGQEFNFW